MASIADVYVTVLPSTSEIAPGVKRALREVDNDAYQAGRRWGREMERGMGRPRIGADTRPGERDVDEFKRKVDKTRATVKLDVDKSGFDAAATSLRNLSTNYKALGVASAAIASPTAIAGTVSVVSQLSGVLGLIPAAAGAAGLAIGSLKVATSGFADAVKEVRDTEKFNEAIQQLAPNAQEAARAIQGMLPALDTLKFTVGDAFFAGLGQQISQLGSTYLPQVQTTMSQIAASANSAMTEVSQQLQTPAMQGDIAEMTNNMASAFDSLSQALEPIVSSFVDIGLVGSGFLPQLADGAARAAEAFSQFVGEARASGDMQSWIEGGIAGFKQLGDIIGNVGQILGGFATAAPEGGGPLGMLQSLTQVAADFINSPAGQGALNTWMVSLRDTMSALAPAAGAFLQAIAPIGGVIGTALVTTVQAIAPALTSWFNAMQPVVQQLSGALTPVIQSLGPVLAQMADILAGQMVSGIQTILPVLIPFVQQWGQALTSIMPLLPALLQMATASLPMIQQAVAMILPPMTTWMTMMGNIANVVVPPLSAAIGAMSTVWQTSFGAIHTAVSTAWTIMQPVFDAIKTAIDTLMGPLDEFFSLASKIPGVSAALKTAEGVASAFTTPGAVPGPAIPALPGVPSSALKPPGTYRTRDGQVRMIPRGTAPIAPAVGVPTTQLPIPAVSTYVAPPVTTGSSSSSGGAVGANNVDAMFALAQQASGRTDYAPASDLAKGLADCSGSISDLYEVLTKGQASSARMFTTVNFASDAEAAKLGFLPGYQEGALNVGVNPYPGNSGHMAATLPNGVNFEGGGGTGGGAQYGGNAAGALDPQFEKQYYLPVPSGSGTSSAYPAMPVGSSAADISQNHLSGTKDQPLYVMPAKEGAFGGAQQLGQDLASGMFEILGIGDIFKDPTQFGLFKIAKAVMGLDVNAGAGGGSEGGGGLFPGGGGGGGGLTSLLSNIPQAFGALNTAGEANAPTPFMPMMPEASGGGAVLPGNMMASPFSPTGANSAAGPGNQPVIDQSVHISGTNQFGYSQTAVQDQIRDQHLSQARVPLMTLPTGP
ncbi:phage tail protein [Mycolicibacterium baixiangningiae]|uniref:phage tail protein n=1 Tax=Mycolicibacterium baixiangningiae TaxID=2761578 RepID=UPI001D01B97A|nr:hypothetical protein [Mycolicibacterium baixiangningiae]